jgi:tetratricopeptide (TPR) repeat protein
MCRPKTHNGRTLDPPQRRRRTLDAVKGLLLRESRERPLLVVFEDLHWIDSETQALLDVLVESLPAARLLLLVNYREYKHHWGNRTYYMQLRLDPLPSENADELLGALLGPDPGLDPLKRRLFERTDGNPFFLEESVWDLVETESLLGKPGGYRLARPLSSIRVPPAVQDVLAARIHRLRPEDEDILQKASVIGKDVPFDLLQAIAGYAEDDLRAAIGRLQDAEFLYEVGGSPDLEYTFKHALTHEVTYKSLFQDDRCRLHNRIVEAIERLYSGRLPEHMERLAHHAFRGELWEKALTYLRQAGSKAAERSSNREAVGYFDQALKALGHLLETETRKQEIDVLFELRNSLYPLAELETIDKHLQKAEALAKTLGDQQALGWVWAYRSSNHVMRGSPATDVRTSAERVEAIGKRLDDAELQVAAQYYLLMACHLSGDYRGTEDVCRSLMQSLQDDGTPERFGLAVFPDVLSRAFLARALAERGEFDDGGAAGQKAIDIAEDVNHPFSLIFARLNLAYLHSVKGDMSEASRLVDRADAQGRHLNITLWTPMVTASLGHVSVWSGRVAEGVSRLEEALEAYKSTKLGFLHSISVVQLGEAYLLADRVEDACTCGEQAVTLARQRGERGHEAWALRLLGEIASHPRRPDVAKAEAHDGAAMTLAYELGMDPLVAHCRLGLAKLASSTGKREQAFENLTTATDMYRDMKMRFWLEKTEE